MKTMWFWTRTNVMLYVSDRMQWMKHLFMTILKWKTEKILRVIIDNKLRFKRCVKNQCKKASRKIWALSRLINYLNNSKKKMIFNALIKSQFSYCPLVWMFCSRQTNDMSNKIHKRALRIVLNDHISDFETMLRNMKT